MDTRRTASNKPKRLRAVVVGGSLGGLCAGLTLRCIGYAVDIFEKSSSALQDRGAGLVVQTELLQYLEQHNIATREAISVPSRFRQYLAQDGSLLHGEASFQLMTAWNTVFRQLREAFPDEQYHQGHKLTGFEQDEHEVIARFENGREEPCDVLVGADGIDSAVRHQLLPDVIPQYAGYVAWRGVVEEDAVPSAVADVFAEKFTFFQMPHSHILCYLVPGAGGELTVGKRRLNWVWYWNVPQGEPLHALLTDTAGQLHHYSVPPGAVSKDLLLEQQAVATQLLPEVFQHLVRATAEPFIQPIYDLASPRMVFGRVCVLGDAAFVPRPHTAASTAKAVTNAIALAETLQVHYGDVVTAFKAWESSQLQLGNYLKRLGMSLGNRSQFGRP